MTQTTPLVSRPVRGPTFWFVKLDTAIEEGDWEEAALAASELKRLGIEVRLNIGRGLETQAEAACA